VPIRILNSRHPDPTAEGAEGTLIGRRAAAPATVKSIACRMNDHLLFALPRDGAGSAGFLEPLLDAAAPFRPSLLTLSTEDGELRAALDHSDRLAEIENALAPLARIGAVHGRAVVSVVSEDLGTDADLARLVLAAAAKWEPRLVIRGVACPVVRFAVELEDLTQALADLHGEIFGDAPEVIA
jgi:hypothetical protein